MVSSANIFGEESRTVIPGQQQSQSTQSWKKKNFARAAIQTPNESARGNIAGKLTAAAEPRKSFESAMAYASREQEPISGKSDSFSFNDVLDIINPLQHIPVLNYVYRGITGDTIKPTSQVFGGAIFGGPVGVVSAAVNFVVEHETGTDIAGNVVSLLTGSRTQQQTPAIDKDNPELNLNAAAHLSREEKEISDTALPFVNLAEPRAATRTAEVSGYSHPKKNFAAKPRVHNISYQSEPRTATQQDLPIRSAVSEISISPMPAKQIY